jgi:hypothetical protein
MARMRGACREAKLWFDASTFEALLLTSPRWTAVSSVVLAERGRGLRTTSFTPDQIGWGSGLLACLSIRVQGRDTGSRHLILRQLPDAAFATG